MLLENFFFFFFFVFFFEDHSSNILKTKSFQISYSTGGDRKMVNALSVNMNLHWSSTSKMCLVRKVTFHHPLN